jgi:lysyl-tRNA synthetase class II
VVRIAARAGAADGASAWTPLTDHRRVQAGQRAGRRWRRDIVARLTPDGPRPAARLRAGHLGYFLFEATAEDKLVQPTFFMDFPLAVSPLARKQRSTTRRFAIASSCS